MPLFMLGSLLIGVTPSDRVLALACARPGRSVRRDPGAALTPHDDKVNTPPAGKLPAPERTSV